MRHSYPALFALLCLFALPRRAYCVDVLAATSLTSCVNALSNCSLRLTVAAAINNGDDSGSGAFLFSLQSAAAAAGGAFAAPDGGPPVFPADSLSLLVRQSPVSHAYPLAYVGDFNDAPYEEVVRAVGGRQLGSFGAACDDAPGAAAPTCGWTGTPAAPRAPFSQGFCCRCSWEDKVNAALVPRSGAVCDLFAGHDSAHCLRMAPLWWSAFAVLAPRTQFTMDVQAVRCRPTTAALAEAAAAAAVAATAAAAFAAAAAAAVAGGDGGALPPPLAPPAAAAANAALAPALTCAAPGAGCECVAWDTADDNPNGALPPLGPALPSRCFPLPGSDAAACELEFALAGTFPPYEGTPDFSSKLLLVPSRCDVDPAAEPGHPCWARLLEGPARWLLVERDMVAAGGGVCNVVGASFEAFATQGAPCGSPVGTCLSGSPAALHAADAARVSAGVPARYYLGAVAGGGGGGPPGAAGGGAGEAALRGAAAAAAAGAPPPPLALVVPTRAFQKTVFTLTLAAAPGSFRLLRRVAGGRIAWAAAEPFTAGAAGALSVRVENLGSWPGAYTLAAACGAGVLPVAARGVTVPAAPPGAPRNATAVTATLPLFSAASAAGGALRCAVTLLDALGGVADSAAVNVSVGALVEDRGTQGGVVGDGGGGRSGSGGANGTTDGPRACGVECASLWDAACALRIPGACAARLAGWAASSAGAIVGVVAALAVLRRPALAAAAARALCGLCRGGAPAAGSAPVCSGSSGGGEVGAGGGAHAPTAPPPPRTAPPPPPHRATAAARAHSQPSTAGAGAASDSSDGAAYAAAASRSWEGGDPEAPAAARSLAGTALLARPPTPFHNSNALLPGERWGAARCPPGRGKRALPLPTEAPTFISPLVAALAARGAPP
jgi:hypothetical protein